MLNRPRRLRADQTIRQMVRETRMSPQSLILPLFIKEGQNIKEAIPSLPGHYYYSVDMVGYAIESALENQVQSVLLFGLPAHKDEKGSEAYAEKGVIQSAVREIKKGYEHVQVITDVCMCEYTSHGHCGIIVDEKVHNDETLKQLSKIALSHAEAGADMVAPSDMMDGRVLAIRETLDSNAYHDTRILSYSAKYSSAFYGPFREVAMSTPAFGDRKSYQMDYHNVREAIKEASIDVEEGADILMVKPALSYLDVIRAVKSDTLLPVCAYSVSGEYAMIKAAAAANMLDEYAVVCKTATSIFRAGADLLISYYAETIANAIIKGDI